MGCFRHTFVTTYIAYVSQTSNPWDVPVKQALNVMQKIWDACSAYKYEIRNHNLCSLSESTCFYWFWDDANLNIFQTVQHLADLWRNIIGSNGIMVLVTFFNTQPELQDSDSGRQEFAKYYIENLHFLYKNSQHVDKKVCDPKHFHNI